MDKNMIATEVIFSDNWIGSVEQIKLKVLIVDRNIFKANKSIFEPLLENTPVFLFDASEANKNINILTEILSFFQKEKINRAYNIVCIGGGITTDIGSFAASVYMRGCKLVLIPTTFLGMIDAAVGGKTEITSIMCPIECPKFKNNLFPLS